MTLDELKELKSSGKFHHATYRDVGLCWEGLYIYVNQDNGFNGFLLHGCFSKREPELLKQAYKIVCDTGVSLGSYGNG